MSRHKTQVKIAWKKDFLQKLHDLASREQNRINESDDKNLVFMSNGIYAYDTGLMMDFDPKIVSHKRADLIQGDAKMEAVTEKWKDKYPNARKSWSVNWDAISPLFKFSSEVRKVIYPTNAIESVNSTYRRLNAQRSVFPSDTALLKALYLATFEAAKKWTTRIRNWDRVLGELAILYEERLPE